METTNNRPVFLTVLCVITFIFSGWSIYSGITNYTSADTVAGIAQNAIEEAKEQIENAGSGSSTAESIIDSVANSLSPEKVKNNAIGTIISSILCLIGAILMWGLNKKGFLLYVLGTLVTIIVPIVVMGGLAGVMTGGLTAFFGILFCVLYGINLKHMS